MNSIKSRLKVLECMDQFIATHPETNHVRMGTAADLIGNLHRLSRSKMPHARHYEPSNDSMIPFRIVDPLHNTFEMCFVG